MPGDVAWWIALGLTRLDRLSAARLKATRIERVENATSGLKSLWNRTHTTLSTPSSLIASRRPTMLQCSNTPSSSEAVAGIDDE